MRLRAAYHCRRRRSASWAPPRSHGTRVSLEDRKRGIYRLAPRLQRLRVTLGIFNAPQLPGCAVSELSGHPWPGKKPGSRIADTSGELGADREHPTVHDCTKVTWTEGLGRARGTPATPKCVSLPGSLLTPVLKPEGRLVTRGSSPSWALRTDSFGAKF